MDDKKELKFKAEMQRAHTMSNLEDNYLKKSYWKGYIRGLRRSYHGENFGTLKEHTLYWKCLYHESPDRQAIGKGYQDGLAFLYGKKRGRPKEKNYVRLPAIYIDAELKIEIDEAIKVIQLSDNEILSVPDFRKRAYRELCQQFLLPKQQE